MLSGTRDYEWLGGVRTVGRLAAGCVTTTVMPPGRVYVKRRSIQKLSGDEVYNTIFLVLLVNIMLCNQLHYQIFSD